MAEFILRPDKIIVEQLDCKMSIKEEALVIEVDGGYTGIKLENITYDEVAELIVDEGWGQNILDNETLRNEVKEEILANHLAATDGDHFGDYISELDMDKLIELADIEAKDIVSYFDEEEIARHLSKEVLANTLMGNNSND